MARRRGDSGHAFEASVHEACIAYAELQTADGLMRGFAQKRVGINRFWPTYPVGLYRAADGWLGATLITLAQWQGFCAMLGLDDLGANPNFFTGLERIEHAAELEAQFMPKLLERPVAHWFAEGAQAPAAAGAGARHAYGAGERSKYAIAARSCRSASVSGFSMDRVRRCI